MCLEVPDTSSLANNNNKYVLKAYSPQATMPVGHVLIER